MSGAVSIGVSFAVRILVCDSAAFDRHAREMAGRGAAVAILDDAERARFALLNPKRPFSACGARLARCQGFADRERGAARLAVDVEVTDPRALIWEAKRRYRSCWEDYQWRPETFAEAAYEILVGSNASPAPLDVGFEIVDKEWVLDVPVRGSLAPVPPVVRAA